MPRSATSTISLTPLIAGVDQDLSPHGAELDGILEEVPQELLQASGVGLGVVPGRGQVQPGRLLPARPLAAAVLQGLVIDSCALTTSK